VEKKTTIIINGPSGVGKDALIAAASQKLSILNVSSIDRVKEIATFAGWDGVKDEKGRQLLIDFKAALVKYGDMPTKYMVDAYKEFLRTMHRFMFVHIREPQEIQKLVTALKREGAFCKTMLISAEWAKKTGLKNDADVFNYRYDYHFKNDKPLEQSGSEFVKLIETIS